MLRGLRRKLVSGAVLGAALGPLPGLAQDAAELDGLWSGPIEENGEVYEGFVAIAPDQDGNPVGTVEYSQPCRGVWASASRQGRTWRFKETITDGRAACAAHVAVTLIRTEEGLEVVLRTVGFDSEARGTLYPFDVALLDTAADAADEAEAAADAALLDATILSAPGWCNPGQTGIEFGHAAGEPWFVNGDRIRVNGRRYAKYGLPRVLEADQLASWSSYGDAAVYVEGTNYDDQVIYVLVGPPASQDEEGECEYQPYQAE